MKYARLVLLSAFLCGCTSFRTTIMQHNSDNRLYPNQPCAKTKGIPVKLKVPTHVEVVVTESYFIQATSTDPKTSIQPSALEAQKAANSAASTLAKAYAAQAKAALILEKASARAVTTAAEAQAAPGDMEKQKAKNEAAAQFATAQKNSDMAGQQVTTIAAAQKAADAAAAAAKTGAALTDPATTPRNVKCREISASLDGIPVRSYDVTTQLIYTDKVFTVDFRRPAGGLLELDTINMDDQQYFQLIAAKYQEQTLEQVTSAIGSITSGITGKSATIDGSKVSGLTSDSRTVAMARFDISNPDWEHELNAFVEKHVTACYGEDCRYQK